MDGSVRGLATYELRMSERHRGTWSDRGTWSHLYVLQGFDISHLLIKQFVEGLQSFMIFTVWD